MKGIKPKIAKLLLDNNWLNLYIIYTNEFFIIYLSYKINNFFFIFIFNYFINKIFILLIFKKINKIL